MNAWLVYDEERAAKNADYIALHHKKGAEYGIEFALKMADECQMALRSGARPDFAIVRTVNPALSRELEEQGVPVFNPSPVSEICNDKYKTYEYVSARCETMPVLDTRFFLGEMLNDRAGTEHLLRQFPHHVLKAVDGHGGSQVFLTDEASYEEIGIMGADFILQPFLKGPGKDVRVYVIGDEIVAAIERQAREGFRSNYSLGGAVRPVALTKEQKGLVAQICRIFDFGLAGIDFLVDERGNFVFNEIEDVVGARMLYQCRPDIDLLGRYFSFILDKLLH